MIKQFTSLIPLVCPSCGVLVRAADGNSKRATCYADCLRKCEKCEIGFSNGKSSPTIIYRNAELNVPLQVREGVRETLALALNEHHRIDKLAKFGFSTAEDALTWTVFNYIAGTGQLAQVFNSLGVIGVCTSKPTMLLWGVPCPMDVIGHELGRRVVAISDRLGEMPSRRSEPDVIIDFGDSGLVVVEVKYRSGNERKQFDPHYYARYLSGSKAFTDAEAIGKSALYELTRNWRIGAELAQGRAFTLINLVLKPENNEVLSMFRKGLNFEMGQFISFTWTELLSTFQKPEWLSTYLSAQF
jgi:hypothetical protein